MDNIRTPLTVFTIVVAGITLATCIGLDANDVNTSADVQGAGNVQAVHDLSDVTADSTATLVTTLAATISTPQTTTTTGTGSNPGGGTKNCSDFDTYAEAKAWYDTYFPAYGDVARLDGDNDGQPCESLPGGPQQLQAT